MSYTPIGWENLPNTTTPINKTNLNKMDNQIKQNADDITTNINDIEGLDTRVTAAEDNISNFNLTIFENITNVSATYGSVSSSLKLAKNSDGSLAKIYGNVSTTVNTGSSSVVTNTITFQTSLRPSSSISINNALICSNVNTQSAHSIHPSTLTIAPDGTCTCPLITYPDTRTQTFMFLPCLYWIKDFGDEPTA